MTESMTAAKAVFVTLLMAGAVTPVRAAAPDKGWMPIDQVPRTLTEAGYGEVRSIEADDGVWKGKASRDGRNVKVSVDPRTGAIVEKGSRPNDD